MSTIVLRNVKGSGLTNEEIDTNFSNLNSDKLESAAIASWAKEPTKPSYTAAEIGAQPELVSGTNIKTVGGNSLLGSGDISIINSWSDVTGKPTTFTPEAHSHSTSDVTGLSTALNGKQDALVSGTNIKTINSASILGSGDITTGDVTLNGTQTLTNKIISGASNTITADGTNAVGFREVPQVSQSAAYTCVLSDSGKHILHPGADTTARTFTIPANASVAYPVGTAITFINQHGAGVVTISITSDTMRLAGAGTTGNRTLAANGVATAIKIATTEWIISGTGLT